MVGRDDGVLPDMAGGSASVVTKLVNWELCRAVFPSA